MLCPNCQVSFLEMKVKSLWLAELKIAQNCSCNWRTRCPAREKSETLEVKRKSSGLLQYLSKHRLAFWNIYSIVHPEEIQNRVPHRSHPPTIPLFLSSLVTGRVRVTYVSWLQLTLKTVVTVFHTAEHCKALVAQKKGMTKKKPSLSLSVLLFNST